MKEKPTQTSAKPPFKDIPDKFLKAYDPAATEDRIYKLWEDSGRFTPTGKGDPFTIIMPPANANGSLHAGHGLVMTIEDIITRYKRMRGFRALWLPGLDHAGFETQVVYEKQLEKEGRTRFDMPREQLYGEILEFTKSNSKNILGQIRKMGASCDWSRQRFTLDPDVIETVYSTFDKLAKDGLLYRGKRIVNWCSKHQTALSDLEVKDEEKAEEFYYLKYGPFVIGTSRPETKFGDKYVVMHPADMRYAGYEHGQKIDLEWINGPVTATIIKDEAIDMAFGTGVMTITPWHDAVDFEIAQRHGLDKEQIIDENGKLLPIAGEFAGMHIKKARPLIIEKLAAKGLVEKIDKDYKHVVRTCYKCGTLIEPQIRSQWYVRMKPLAEKALKAIKDKEIAYIPDHYEKISVHWLENIMDWNISRQIVWGIPIPAKICTKCDEGYADTADTLEKCAKCGGGLRKDTDTFDTWFSSGQWPYVTLGYPDSADYKAFYPTDVMETAGDIIFFWVSRMIMFGLYVTGKLPFKTVYLHGLVLDGKGQKMSKSKGNVINPIDYVSKFGTDAFRMALTVGNTPGSSLALSEDKVTAYKKFVNKLWNIARFVAQSTDACDAKLAKEDQAIYESFGALKKEITKEMDEFKFYIVAEKLYHYVWHEYADKLIEDSKPILAGEDKAAKDSRSTLLNKILSECVKMLHPFMPFITEELWQTGHGGKGSMLMTETWPA